MQNNKRFLAIALVFIIVGGVVISCSFVFRVQRIDPMFTNNPRLIIKRGIELGGGTVDSQSIENQALASYRTSALKVAKGKNILFGLDRNKIKSAIEGGDPLVRVTNIEAKFPNRIEIKVQERYPMYYVQNGSSTAILDYELRILSTSADLIEYYGDLINLTPTANPQFEFVEMDNFKFQYGENLKNFVKPDYKDRIDDLAKMVLLFFGDGHPEHELRTLIELVDFNNPLDTMVIKLKKDPLVPEDFIRIAIRDYKNRFAEKLTVVWKYVQEHTDYRNGMALVQEGVDGTLVAAWFPQEG